MIAPEQAVAITTRAAEARATGNADWADVVHHTVRALIDRLAAAKGMPPTGLPYPHCPTSDAVLDELGPLDGWHILDIGEIHQRLLELTLTHDQDGRPVARRESLAKRATQGTWYTPAPLAEAMCRLSIGPQLDRLAAHPDPGNLLQVLAIDPACGAGVFLIEAARLIAGRLAARISGHDPAPEAHLRAALPVVMRECIFGIDIDPVAVDLAKAALWLEIDGSEPFGFMDRNIICGNPLDLDQPPAFTEKRSDPPTAAERRHAFAAQAA